MHTHMHHNNIQTFLSWKERKNTKQLLSSIHTSPQSVQLKASEPPRASLLYQRCRSGRRDAPGRAGPGRARSQPASLCSRPEHHYHQQRALSDAPARDQKKASQSFPLTELLCNWHLGPAIILPLIYFTEFRLHWGSWEGG